MAVLPNSEQKLLDISPERFDNIIFLHSPASSPDGPDPSFVLVDTFQIISVDRFSNLNGFISSGVSVRRMLSCAGSPFGYFCFSKSIYPRYLY